MEQSFQVHGKAKQDATYWPSTSKKTWLCKRKLISLRFLIIKTVRPDESNFASYKLQIIFFFSSIGKDKSHLFILYLSNNGWYWFSKGKKRFWGQRLQNLLHQEKGKKGYDWQKYFFYIICRRQKKNLDKKRVRSSKI